MQDRLKEILLKVKKEVFSGNLGNNISTFKGSGLDFSEIRDYEIGDDVRSINWKASAKNQGIKVNLFNEERELNIVVAFLNSGTLNFGTKRLKQDLMAEILGFLAYSALKNSDNLTTLFFSDKPEKLYKPTKNPGILPTLIEEALKIETLGKSVDYEEFCNFINSSIKRKSLIFLIGDFYGDVDISTIAHKNEVYALIARDRFEESPKFSGDVALVSPIDFKEESFSFGKSEIKEYEALIREHDQKIYEHFLAHKVRYGKIYTDDDVYLRISQILKG